MPPIAAVTGGITIILLCFLLRIPIFLIGIVSVILLIYTIFLHTSLFQLEYKTMSAPAFLKQNAPIFIILAVILIALAYILYLFGPKAIITNEALTTSSLARRNSSQGFSSFNPFGSRQGYNDYNRRSDYNKQFRVGV
jgi:cellobiose-specific phosphotransferase system component IIC